MLELDVRSLPWILTPLPVECLDSEHRKHGSPKGAEMSWIIWSEKNHAPARGYVVENEDETDNPPNAGYAHQESVDDASKAWQSFRKAEHAK